LVAEIYYQVFMTLTVKLHMEIQVEFTVVLKQGLDTQHIILVIFIISTYNISDYKLMVCSECINKHPNAQKSDE
jgi:hypothetical protein